MGKYAGRLGKFITIEGIDFTGKSTICRRIATILKKQKRGVILFRDPPLAQPWGDLKQFFETQEKISKLSEATLLLAARLDNYERIIKHALAHGVIVLGDRYIDSWFAYQSYRLRSYFNGSIKKTLDFLVNINNFLQQHSFLSMPDLTILIVDDPKKTLTRAKTRDAISKYEKIKIQNAVQRIYIKLARKFHPRIRIINAKGKNIDIVFKEAYTLCNKLLV
jgi:dTMP kinase